MYPSNDEVNTAGLNAVPEKPREVRIAIEELEKTATRLYEDVQKLQSRISPILDNEGKETNKEVNPATRNEKIGQQILTTVEFLHKIDLRLRGIISRLQI